MNQDDYATRSYSQTAFYKQDNTRLVLKKSDGTGITADELEEISKVSNVKMVESCDYANDINFYINEGVDYEYQYGEQRRRDQADDIKRVAFLKEDKFMMSSDCIDDDDLAFGRLPENRNEIVLYSEDEDVLDTEKLIYFVAHNIWEQGEYYMTNVKIVGILKEKTEQIYFSNDLCKMLSMHMDSGIFRILYNYDHDLKDYRMKPALIPIINENLADNEVRVSGLMEDQPPNGELEYTWQNYDEEGEPLGEASKGKVIVREDRHESTEWFVEVSESFFDQYYQYDGTQATVYITSYAKTDSVIRKLKSMGYEAISTYRASMTDYISELVNQRLIIIGISAFGLFALLLAEILILRSLMKIRIKDYFVLKFIGMKMQIIKKISYFEMAGYALWAMVFTVILMWILRYVGIPIIQNIMWYYDIGAYLLFALYNMVLVMLTVAFFNRLLKGRLNA